MTETMPAAQYGKATDLGFDPTGGPWVAVCRKHNTSVNVSNRDKARAAARNTAEFCEDCRDIVQSTDEVSYSDTQEPIEQETDPSVKLQQVEAFDQSLRNQAQAWLAEQNAKHVSPDPNPVQGTYRDPATGTAHDAVSVIGLYMHPACRPDKPIMHGEEVTRDDTAMCPYCLSGVLAPTEEQTAKRRGRRPAEPKAQVEPTQAPLYPVLTEALLEATTRLTAAMEDHPSIADAVAAVDILSPALDKMRQFAPRRRVGKVTGARSGLVKQSKTFQPSIELDEVKQFADGGDKRAQDILDHVAAYKPGEDCSYCLNHGRQTRHGYATAFMSVGRELRAMRQRAEMKKKAS